MAALTTEERLAVRQLMALLLHPRPALARGKRPRTGSLPLGYIRGQLLAPQAFRAGYSAFEDDYLRARLFSRMRRACLVEIATAFDGAELDLIPIRGLSHALWLYADPALRPTATADVLVREQELSRALRVAEGLGYVAVPRTAAGPVTLARGTGASAFAVVVHIDIPQPAGGRYDLHGAWRRARPGDIDGLRTLRLHPLDAVLAHAAWTAHEHLRVPLVAWVDSAHMLGALEPNEISKLRDAGRAARLAPAVAVTTAMTRAFAARAATLPRRSRAAAAMPSVDELLERPPVSAARRRLRDAALLQGPTDMARIAVGRLIRRRNNS